MREEQLQAFQQLAKTSQWKHREHYSLNEKQQYWLKGNQSLTKLLIENSKTFEVSVIDERIAKPHAMESRKLDLSNTEEVRVREVVLYCDDKAAVYARSIIPLAALQGMGSQLDTLGNKPLGHLLFKNAKVDLETSEVAQTIINGNSRWARRTNYCFNQCDILVSEYFLFEMD